MERGKITKKRVYGFKKINMNPLGIEVPWKTKIYSITSGCSLPRICLRKLGLPYEVIDMIIPKDLILCRQCGRYDTRRTSDPQNAQFSYSPYYPTTQGTHSWCGWYRTSKLRQKICYECEIWNYNIKSPFDRRLCSSSTCFICSNNFEEERRKKCIRKKLNPKPLAHPPPPYQLDPWL